MTSQTDEIWLAASAVATLAQISTSRIQLVAKRAIQGKLWRDSSLAAREARGTGGKQYEILLSSLPDDLQASYAVTHPTDAPAIVGEVGSVSRSLNKRFLRPLTPIEREGLHANFERLPTSMQQKAKRRFAVVCAFADHKYGPLSSSQSEIAEAVGQEFGAKPATLLRWYREVSALDRGDWFPALAPRYVGCQIEAEFTEKAWTFISEKWLSTSKPALKPIYEEACRGAQEHGWKIPCYETVRNRIRALPEWRKRLRRLGKDALTAMYPSQPRDYLTLQIHEAWCADGRRADVFCKWLDGHVGRPIVVGWIDIRSRYGFGFTVGKTESADLIRSSFRRGAQQVNAIPREMVLDNGRGFTAKMLSGGQAHRFRGKVKEDDPVGAFKLMDIQIHWAQPYNGRAKPIESYWNNIAQHVDKHIQFEGAYCGSSVDDKPSDFHIKNAVPIETYIARLNEVVVMLNERTGHRGHGMNRRSPAQIYAELLPLTQPRQLTEMQLMHCLLVRKRVMLNQKNHSVEMFGNVYWCEELAALTSRGPYDVLGDPEDATVDVRICDGLRLITRAPLVERKGFFNQQAAKDHGRATRSFKKACRQMDKATAEQFGARSKWLAEGDRRSPASALNPKTNPKPPIARVSQLVPIPMPSIAETNEAERKRSERIDAGIAYAARMQDQYRPITTGGAL